MASVLTDGVEWASIAAFPGLEQVYRGRHGVAEWMNAVRSSFGDFDVTLESVIRDLGDALVVAEQLRASGRESGAEVEMRIFTVYRFEGDRLASRHAFVTEQEALEAAGLADSG